MAPLRYFSALLGGNQFRLTATVIPMLVATVCVLLAFMHTSSCSSGNEYSLCKMVKDLRSILSFGGGIWLGQLLLQCNSNRTVQEDNAHDSQERLPPPTAPLTRKVSMSNFLLCWIYRYLLGWGGHTIFPGRVFPPISSLTLKVSMSNLLLYCFYSRYLLGWGGHGFFLRLLARKLMVSNMRHN